MKKIYYLISVIFLLSACHKTDKPLIIVSKEYKSQAFHKWLMDADSNINIVSAYGIHSDDSLYALIKRADGIIISGGEDVNPALYNEPQEIKRCGKINPYRDSLEQKLIRYAIKHKIPLLGICRGHQIINVTLGGSLIVDIPQDIGSDTLHRKDGHATMHMVYIQPGTYLHNIVGVDSGMVRSNHHQAVKQYPPMLRVSAYAPDTVIEATELRDTTQMFLLTLQWHPEGMDYNSPLSGRIRQVFLYKVHQHFKTRKDGR